MSTDPGKSVQLTLAERELVVSKKATCPFIGPAIAQGHLPVFNTADNPLARIDDVKELGNRGRGSTLGFVLALFASGNHALMRDASGQLNQAVAHGLFSLDFPGSQGSHAGHSGILQGDPAKPDSGRFIEAEFKRLTDRQVGGVVKRSAFGAFIVDNLLKDNNSRVQLAATVASTASTLAELGRLVPLLIAGGATHRDVTTKLTKILGGNHLVGSAGEFGLLFAFLAKSPKSKTVDGEPALAVEDLDVMFVKKQLPGGWETWEKSAFDWMTSTAELARSAAKEYHARKP